MDISTLKVIKMKNRTIKSSIGNIECYVKEIKGSTPIIFLHGVYYDHNLWNYQISRVTDRTTIAIDMPLHGRSKQISKKDWTMEDCSIMLLEILDHLDIQKCYAVGHSWGSMTILRAAVKAPNRFKGIGLCNMPLEEGNVRTRLQFKFQHLLLPFRKFYTQQVMKTMFSNETLQQKPQVAEYLEISMNQLSNMDIRKTDRAVITHVESGFPYLSEINIPALTIKGKDDYVPTPSNLKTQIVNGKHTSPLEQPEAVTEMILELIKR